MKFITHPFALVLLALTFALFAFGFGFANYPIIDMNEGLYAEVAREMLATGHYIIPHLNGVVYLEKPPLLYWLLAMSYHFFGVSTLSARLIPLAASLLTCCTLLLTSHLLKHLRSGCIAVILLSSSLIFIIIGRIVFFDMLLTAFLTIALCAFFYWYQTQKKSALYLTSIALGCAFLTKGLLPVGLFGLIALTFFIFRKPDQSVWKALFCPMSIGLFLLISLPWMVLAFIKQPAFAWDHFVNEQIFRLLNKREPSDYHTGPLYYYIPRVFAYLFPWSLWLLTLVSRAREKWFSGNPLKPFLWIWFLIPLIVFSLAGDKGDYYMVIAIPPLAWLIALFIEDLLCAAKVKPLFIFFLSMVIFYGVTLVVLYLSKQEIPETLYRPLLFASMGVIFMTMIVIVFYAWTTLSPSPHHAPITAWGIFICTALLIVPSLYLYVHFKKVTTRRYSQFYVAQYVLQQHRTHPIFLYQNYDRLSSFVFFLGRPIPLIDSMSDDLAFGSKIKDAKNKDLFLSTEDFKTLAQHQAVDVLLVKKKWESFQQVMQPLMFHAINESERAILVSNEDTNVIPRP
jgi:4-amino-4-deoxy-L-arabinose transferase-like glycosyltransferase